MIKIGSKIPVQLTDVLRGQIQIVVSIPKTEEPVCRMYNIGKQEQENLIGQKLQEILQYFGVES